MADEGAGATLTFGTSGTSLDLLTIQGTGISREDIDITHHGTTSGYKEYQPADRVEGGEVPVTILYDPDVRPPFNAAKETITITYPIPSGKVGGATEAFSGYINNFDRASLEIDQRMEAGFTLKVAGAITFTNSTTA